MCREAVKAEPSRCVLVTRRNLDSGMGVEFLSGSPSETTKGLVLIFEKSPGAALGSIFTLSRLPLVFRRFHDGDLC